jgi:Holliday junction resolvasome RuvABC endonuclease subunit
MRVLGLDPSLTNFGWAIHDTSGTGLTRCPARGRFQTSAKTLYIARYMDLRARLITLVREQKPDRVGIEFPVFGDLYSEGMYGLFLFCSEALYLEGMDVVFWSPLQIKEHARDSLGRPAKWAMQKPDMVESALADTGGTGKWNHNEADAYLAARLSARFWLLLEGELQEADLTVTEQRLFLGIKTFIRGKNAGKVKHTGVAFREDERFHLWSQEAEHGKGTNPRTDGQARPRTGRNIQDPEE